MEIARTRNEEDLKKNLPRVDEVGKCFNEGTHYYRQDKNRVLHVNLEGDGNSLVNTLHENHLNDGRINWGHSYKEIDPYVFSEVLEKSLEIFFDV